MRQLAIIICVFFVVLANISYAAIDDFEDIGPDCTPVTTRVIHGVTVTISTHGEYPMTARTYYDSVCWAFMGVSGHNDPLNPENVSGTRFISSFIEDGYIGFPQAQPIIFQFDQPVTLFGLTTLDLCENDDPNPELRLQAFNQSNNKIDEHRRSGPQGQGGLDLDWVVTGNGIVKVLLTGTTSDYYKGYGIDDLVLMTSSEGDFEDVGPDCTPVTTRVIDGVTVTISTQGGYPMTARTYYDSICQAFLGSNNEPNAPLNPGNVSGSRFISSIVVGTLIGFPQAQPIIFQFSQPVKFFGLTTLDLCEDTDPSAELKLQAFDYLNTLIDEHSRSGPQGPSGIDLDWGVCGNGIVKALLTGTISVDAPGYGIDDLILAAQPCPCQITVTFPNGGEKINPGGLLTIEWNSVCAGNSATIYYSIDNGANWGVITENTTNIGSYEWTVPGVQSDVALIRVCSVSNPSCCDESDATFYITPDICNEPYVKPLDVFGSEGSLIVVDILISQNQDEINSFRFDLSYDMSMLTYVSCEPGDLTQEWMSFQGSLIEPGGNVRIGGFDTSVTIPAYSSGVIAKVNFLVTCFDCNSGDQSALCVGELRDDLVGMNGCCGEFTLMPCERGDVNFDEDITPGDALCAFWRSIERVFREECMNECAEDASDVNCDNDVTPGDALCIFWRSIEGTWREECECVPGPKTVASAVEISCGAVTGIQGEKICIPVIVENAEDLDAFAMELTYPVDLLIYDGVLKTVATEGWIALDGAEIDEGRIKLGGFHTEGIGSDGSTKIAQIVFSIREGVAGFSEIGFINLMDDLAGGTVIKGEVDVKGIPENYSLSQNYPNPFNPETEIRYEIPREGEVQLVVYNVMGQEVVTLVNTHQSAGAHVVKWNADEMSSGIYFYRLKINDFTATRRMVLMK